MCLTSGLAGSFIRVRCGKARARARARTTHLLVFAFTDVRVRERSAASIRVVDWWRKGTGWLEGLYRFVDETMVIRHCV